MTTAPLLRLERLPVLQNKVFPTRDAAIGTARGTLVLQQDPRTGVVCNSAFDPGLLLYDTEYQNEQACSPSFRSHLDDVLAVVRRHFGDPSVIEIGCGKGYFLGLLRQAGFTALGVDPAYEGDSGDVIKAPFARELGLSAPGLVMRHVLEHIQDPLDFLSTVADANGHAGRVYIEVPCFDWICRHKAWFDVFYEHVNYFRLSDFQRMFGTILEAGHLFGGQYLYVVADLRSFRTHVEPGPVAQLPAGFLDGIVACRDVALRAAGPRAIWGGSSKGVLFAHHLCGQGVDFEAIIDLNPAKQGAYAAGTGLQIISPREAVAELPRGTTVFVMNPNYHQEIALASEGRFNLVNVDAI